MGQDYYLLRCVDCDEVFKPLRSTEPHELLVLPPYEEEAMKEAGLSETGYWQLEGFQKRHRGHKLVTEKDVACG